MLKIGFASRDFTPQRPAMIQGQMHVRVGRSARDPLTLTAMAVDGGESRSRAIIVSFDLAMVSDQLVRMVRHRLARDLPDAPSDGIILAATHTHESLVFEDNWYPWPGGDVMSPGECLELIAARAVEAAAEAWSSREAAHINRAFGHAVVAHNRRAVYADGSALMYGKTDRPDFAWIEGGADHGLDMVFVWRNGGDLAGLVLVVPCPSQVDEHISEFSADFWHEIRLELRRRLGGTLNVVGLCGAAGDQSPHFLLQAREEAEMRRRRGTSERQEIAQRAADAVERALVCTQPLEADVPLAHLSRRVSLTAMRTTRAQRDWAQMEYERWLGGGGEKTSWWPTRQREVVEAFDSGRAMPPVEVELHALRLGDAVVVTNPFEMFIDYGRRIKARSPAAQTMVVQIAAGRGLYLPTERAVRGGHYSAIPSVCLVGPEGGAQLVDQTLSMIGDLWSNA